MFIELGADIMEKQYYAVREIILGLRSEYLKNQEALNHLKSYLAIQDENVKEFRLGIGDKEKEEIVAYLEKRGSLLDSILKKFIQNYIKEEKEQVHNSEILFFSKSLKISLTKTPLFKKEVKLIFESPFVQKVTLNSILLTGEDYNIHFGINPQGIKIYKSELGTFDSLLEYNASKDILSFNRFDKLFSSMDVSKLLEMKIPSMILKNYHKELVEQLGNKPLYAEVFSPCKRADFKFEEQENKLLLVKTRD